MVQPTHHRQPATWEVSKFRSPLPERQLLAKIRLSYHTSQRCVSITIKTAGILLDLVPVQEWRRERSLREKQLEEEIVELKDRLAAQEEQTKALQEEHDSQKNV